MRTLYYTYKANIIISQSSVFTKSANRNADDEILKAQNHATTTKGFNQLTSIHAINLFYIRSVYSQYHVDLFKCIEQNVNNQSLTTLCSCFHFFCLKVIRSWINRHTGGHGHVICMCGYNQIKYSNPKARNKYNQLIWQSMFLFAYSKATHKQDCEQFCSARLI